MMHVRALTMGISVTITGLALAVPVAAASGPTDAAAREGLSTAAVGRLGAGIQVAPLGSGARGANPFISYLPDVRTTDFAAWTQRVQALSAQRARSTQRQEAKDRWSGSAERAVLTYAEKEPATAVGDNDTTWRAERVAAFGLGSGLHNRMRVTGTLSDQRPGIRTLPSAREDNGSIPKAAPTGIDGNDRVRVSGKVGDGPYGSTSGDFDWYAVRAAPGESLSVALPTSSVDTVALLVDSSGTIVDVAWNSVDGSIPDRSIQFRSTTGGAFYVMVSDFGGWQTDFNDSSSGVGAGPKGTYTVEMGSYRTDRDAVLVKLRRGDVVGTSVSGQASRVTVQSWDSTVVTATSEFDATFFYPANSPLPGGGNAATAYVAERDGWYGVIVERGIGTYRNEIEVYRPGGERTTAPQTIVLDFDGATVNPADFAGPPGVATLSPLKAFLARWGLTSADLPALARQITQTATENLRADLRDQGIPNLAVRVVNGLTDPDTFGAANVSRVVVGGTIAESGIPTIGIASAIDPGNYGREDSALVLLDVMSEKVAGNDRAVSSVNYYLRPGVGNRVALVGRAIGNVVSHEVGHYIGNFHTDNSNSVVSLMDAGGRGYWRMYNTGPDWVLGTSDDGDTDFTTDRFSLNEPFFGVEDTATVSAWAFSGKR